MSPHLTTFQLDLVVLSPGTHPEAEAHLGLCSHCQTRVTEVRRAAETTSVDLVPRTLPCVQARLSRRPLFAFLAPMVALAAAASVFLLWLRPPTSDLTPKGGATFQVFAKHGVRVFALDNSAHLQPGDQLRFVVGPHDMTQLLVASLDPAGSASIYYPFGGDRSASLASADRLELPGSVTLDGTLGEERLFAVFSRASLRADDVLRAVRERGKSGELGLPNTEVLVLTFEKTTGN